VYDRWGVVQIAVVEGLSNFEKKCLNMLTKVNDVILNVLIFLTCTFPPTLKRVPLPMCRLRVKQMLRTWMKALLRCEYKYLLTFLVTLVVTYKKKG